MRSHDNVKCNHSKLKWNFHSLFICFFVSSFNRLFGLLISAFAHLYLLHGQTQTTQRGWDDERDVFRIFHEFYPVNGVQIQMLYAKVMVNQTHMIQ